jgi:hypothetical protein
MRGFLFLDDSYQRRASTSADFTKSVFSNHVPDVVEPVS